NRLQRLCDPSHLVADGNSDALRPRIEREDALAARLHHRFAAARSTSSNTFARAASSPSGFLPPACAISGRPPPVPPTSVAISLITSPARTLAVRSLVTTTKSETLPSLAPPSAMTPLRSLSRI